jgi:hypothetical protein
MRVYFTDLWKHNLVTLHLGFLRLNKDMLDISR